MQAVRTGLWVLFAIMLTAFAAMNFHTVEVHIYPDGNGYSRLEWPLAFVSFVSFLLGFLPMLLVYRTAKWSAQRKIKQQNDTIAMLRPTPPSASAPVESPVPFPQADQAG